MKGRSQLMYENWDGNIVTSLLKKGVGRQNFWPEHAIYCM